MAKKARKGGKSRAAAAAQQVPKGSLIIYSLHGQKRAAGTSGEISALDFAPSVLSHFGVVPSYMRRADLLAGH